MAVEKKVASQKSGSSTTRWVINIVIFLLEILLPAFIIGGALYWFAGAFNLWKLDRTIALVLFAILLVMLSFILSSFFSMYYSMSKTRQGLMMRIVVMLLGGFIVPGLLFAGANLLKVLPDQQVIMSRLIQMSTAPLPAQAQAGPMSAVILSSKSPYTQAEGIKAINSSHTSADLEQLFIILNTDSAGLSNQLVADALSQALASYGTAAKQGLIAAFQGHAKPGGNAAVKASDTLYERYFAQSIAGMQAEINSQAIDDQTKQVRLAQVTALSNQIKTSLSDLQTTASSSSQGDPLLGIVMDSCLQMKLTSDNDLYGFAKTTAADVSLPDAVRGKALLLIAKLGGKDDLALLNQYLTNNSETIKASAFTAIANLNQNLETPVKTK
jgi:hypothetical protein